MNRFILFCDLVGRGKGKGGRIKRVFYSGGCLSVVWIQF